MILLEQLWITSNFYVEIVNSTPSYNLIVDLCRRCWKVTEVYKLMHVSQHKNKNFQAPFLITIEIIFACICNACKKTSFEKKRPVAFILIN